MDIFDSVVKSQKMIISVIPAQAGIKEFEALTKTLDTGWNSSRFSGTGVTTFYGTIIFEQPEKNDFSNNLLSFTEPDSMCMMLKT